MPLYPSVISVRGSATLNSSGGTVTVSNGAVTATSMIVAMGTSSGSTSVGDLRISAQSAGSFTVASNNILDGSTFNYIIFN